MNEPPYDETADTWREPPWRALRQATLPLTLGPPSAALPAAPPSTAVPSAPANKARTERAAAELADRRPWRQTARSELCDPQPWAARLSRGIAEVLSGTRSARQLAAWFTGDALAALMSAARGDANHGRPADASARRPRVLVRSVRTCEPTDGACEISVHLRVGGRSHAVAIRAEGRNGRWICTEFVLG